MSKRFKFQVKTLDGSTTTLDIPENFTFQDVKQAIDKDVGTDGEKFTWLCVKQFTLKEPNLAKQTEIVGYIKQNRILTQVFELLGGSNNLSDVLSESDKQILLKQTKRSTCGICLLEDSDTIALTPSCSMVLCVDCLMQFIKLTVWQTSSWTCPCTKKHKLDIFNIPDLSTVAFSLSEKMMYAQQREVMTFVNCRLCDKIYSNPTPAAYKRCPVCNIDICGFCGTKWDKDHMKKQDFYCGDTCRFISHISFELEKFEYNKSLSIPNRRFCPSCGRLGAYGKKCKWNTCSCGVEYCFYCVNSKKSNKCINREYDQKCVEPVQQNLQELWDCHLKLSRI